jgi:uncharacterized protein YlxW (UPF0749 family)
MTASSPRPDNLSVALLIDLATNTLDPGYAAAAKRRAAAGAAHRSKPWVDATLATLGSLLVGFILVLAYVDAHRSAPAAAKVHADLVARVRSAQSTADQLDANAQRLSAQVDSLRNQALAGSAPLRDQLQREQLLAGTIAVKGSGFIVQLANPPTPTAQSTGGRKAITPIGATQVLTDRDLRSVVNQLWLEGAEAISVNDIRLTPISTIRFAGQAVLVDFEPINAPYTVRAIGNPEQLDTGFAASAVASRYQTLASADGFGFSFDESKQLLLPARTVGGLSYASSVPSSGAPPPTGSSTASLPPTSPTSGAPR